MSKRITIVEDILSSDEQIAAQNRAKLDDVGVLAINLMASPGAGKTSLIEHTVRRLQPKIKIAVIDGDIATDIDAERAEAAGALAVQINTGGQCHLDANMIGAALGEITLNQVNLLIVENVGNLICPAGFDLGVHQNILIASIPEGDDKPYKYPGMYRDVDVLVINKIDLLPYITFDLDYFCQGVEVLNPGLLTFPVSCKTGEGLDAWFDWLVDNCSRDRMESRLSKLPEG
jgi:hydrogenase nickel incorporation protein HypB